MIKLTHNFCFIGIPTLIMMNENHDIITTSGCNSVRSDPDGTVCSMIVHNDFEEVDSIIAIVLLCPSREG